MKTRQTISNSRLLMFGLLGAVLAAMAFAFDLQQPLGVAAGIPYIAIVGLGLLARSRRLVVGFSVIGVVLIALGYWGSDNSQVASSIALSNRAMSLLALLMVAVISYVLLHTRDKYQEELIALASIDSLTRISNRRVIMEQLEKNCAIAQRYVLPVSALMLDIDHFKKINDDFGHPCGDEVLKRVGSALQAGMRDTDALGRYGGEEFLVVCPNTNAKEASTLAERLRVNVENLALDGLNGLSKVTTSVGVATSEDGEMPAAELVSKADKGLYLAKQQGRNCVVTAS